MTVEHQTLADRTASLEHFEQLAWERRTNLNVDPDLQVSESLVERLCELVSAAPNHKRTWPWRFALFTNAGRSTLGETFAAAVARSGADDHRVHKTRTKYLRAPSILVVGSDSPNPSMVAEDGHAVAAGIQNLLLGATAAGLASFWSSPPDPHDAATLELCGFDQTATIVAVIYLGWPTRPLAPPARPPIAVRRVAS